MTLTRQQFMGRGRCIPRQQFMGRGRCILFVVAVGQGIEHIPDSGGAMEGTLLLALCHAGSRRWEVGEVNVTMVSRHGLKALAVDHQRVNAIASIAFEHVCCPRRASAIGALDNSIPAGWFASIRLWAIACSVTDTVAIKAFPLTVFEEWLTAIASRVLPPTVATPQWTNSRRGTSARRCHRSRSTSRSGRARLDLATPTL